MSLLWENTRIRVWKIEGQLADRLGLDPVAQAHGCPGFNDHPDEQGNDRGAQEALEQIIEFKQRYPEVKLVFGHDLETR